MMKNYNLISILFLSLFSVIAFGQVGIGTTTPDASAIVEISNANKGTLISRVALNNVTDTAAPVATPATGLLVYNTNAAVTGGVGTGFYYFDGTVWQPLGGAGASSWALTGNNNTTPAANYVGTSDAQDFVVRTNATEAMRVTSAGDVGIGTNAPTSDIHISNNVSASSILNDGFEDGTLAPFTTGGDRNWLIGFNPCTGLMNAEVDDNLSNSQISWMEYTTTIPATGGQVSFNYAVSTEANFDIFRFYINGATELEASGTVACTSVSYTLNPGPVTLRWEYSKDVNFNSGDDTPYVDDIFISELADPIIRIADGTEAANRILYTDANGNGTWGDAPSGFADVDWIFNSGSTNTDPIYHEGIVMINQQLYLVATFSDFYINNGLSQGTQVGIGSVEFIIDALNATLFSDSLEPLNDNTYSLGNATFRWDTLYSTNGYTSTSDGRFKQDIEAIPYGMNQIMQLRPVSYLWKDFKAENFYKAKKGEPLYKDGEKFRPINDNKMMGFIAQELNEVVPEVVHTYTWEKNQKTGVAEKVPMKNLGVSYSDLIPVLIKGIQEQQETLEKIEKEQKEIAKEITSKQ